MQGYIYKVINLINQKIYIGKKCSSEFDENYFGSGSLITAAVLYYGKQNFKLELIEQIQNKNDLDIREMYWINFYNSTDLNIGYNLSKGGIENDLLAANTTHTSNNEEVKLLLEFKKKYYGNKKVKKEILDPKNVIVIHKGQEKKFVNIVKADPYFKDGWGFGWPE